MCGRGAWLVTSAACGAALVGLTALAQATFELRDVRSPIEVEWIADPLSCGPGSTAFDSEFRAILGREFLHRVDAAGGKHRHFNNFMLASAAPHHEPIRIRVRVDSDASIVHDFQTLPAAVKRAEHVAVQVAVPFRGHRWAFRRTHRTSFWIRTDRGDPCKDLGRTIALVVLDALHAEIGALPRGEHLGLGPAVSRDPVFSEVNASSWRQRIADLPASAPILAGSLAIYLVAFVGIRVVRLVLTSRRAA